MKVDAEDSPREEEKEEKEEKGGKDDPSPLKAHKKTTDDVFSDPITGTRVYIQCSTCIM